MLATVQSLNTFNLQIYKTEKQQINTFVTGTSKGSAFLLDKCKIIDKELINYQWSLSVERLNLHSLLQIVFQ